MNTFLLMLLLEAGIQKVPAWGTKMPDGTDIIHLWCSCAVLVRETSDNKNTQHRCLETQTSTMNLHSMTFYSTTATLQTEAHSLYAAKLSGGLLTTRLKFN